MLSNRLLALAPGASSPTRARASRCFRTMADGRIPLAVKWPTLFDTLRAFGPIALQTRHAYARLVTTEPLPPLTWREGGLRAGSDDGGLRFRFDQQPRAWGRLELCACCGSAGRIEVHNAHAQEFLQFCAEPSHPAAAWADVLAGLLGPEPAAETPPPAPVDFPQPPSAATPLVAHSNVLVPLLTALSGSGTAIAWTLRTSEVSHTREFSPVEIDLDGAILTARDGRSTAQFSLGVVRALAVSRDVATWPLHLLGPDATLLLTLSGAQDPASNAAWRTLLGSTFPELC